MEFSNILNNYIDLLNCSSKELSEASGLSPAAISRYRNNERIPSFDSEQFNKLISGIVKIANDKNIKNISIQSITEELSKTYGNNTIDFNIIKENINILINRIKNKYF